MLRVALLDDLMAHLEERSCSTPIEKAGGAFSTCKQQYAVSSDGQRFLVNLDAEEGVTSPITLIYKWKSKP